MNFGPSVMQSSFSSHAIPSSFNREKYSQGETSPHDEDPGAQGCTLFVGDLSRHVSRDDIFQLFSNYGVVFNIFL